jgi:hypothetical protein
LAVFLVIHAVAEALSHVPPWNTFLPENAADFEPARVLRTVKPEARWLLKEWRAQKQ